MTPSAGFDTVAHLDHPDLGAHLPAIVAAARRAGVTGWLVPAGDPQGWPAVVEAAERSGGIAALGLHPWWAAASSDAEVDAAIARLALHDPPVVGEIGLDALHATDDRARAAQRRAFRAQLAWAREHDRPVLIHAVRSVPEVLDVIRRDGLPPRGGAVHGWTAATDLAQRVIALGLHLSFGPTALGRTARKARDSLRAIPLGRVVIETGCPCPSAPDGPSDLRTVADGLARVLDLSPAHLLATTGTTARALFAGVG